MLQSETLSMAKNMEEEEKEERRGGGEESRRGGKVAIDYYMKPTDCTIVIFTDIFLNCK